MAATAPPVIIAGAGISGLVLGRSLLRRGIRFSLWEKNSKETFSRRHNYAIDLEPWAYQPLLKELDISESNFRSKLAVTGADADNGSSIIRVHRGKFERLLAKELQEVRGSMEPPLKFDTAKNELPIGQSLVIGADGPHSDVRRAVLPNVELEVLPFAVFFGSKRLSVKEYDATYKRYLSNKPTAQTMVDGSLLRVLFDGSTAEDTVGMHYTWSRTVRDKEDKLFNPFRAKEESQQLGTQIDEAIAPLAGKLDGLYRNVFNTENMKSDRKLHWLMRSKLVDREQLSKVARENKVVMIGDAAHHQPIIGSEGANYAIKDTIDLADFLNQSHDKETLGDLNFDEFYSSTYETWAKENDSARGRIFEMHGEKENSIGSVL